MSDSITSPGPPGLVLDDIHGSSASLGEQARVLVLKDLSRVGKPTQRGVCWWVFPETGSDWLRSMFSQLSLSPALPVPF